MEVRKHSVLVVSQAFKGTLGASEVAAALESGVIAAGAEPSVVLGSDGGDGLLESLSGSISKTSSHNVTGALGAGVNATVGWLEGNVAIVESRFVCGQMVEVGHDPLRASTLGLGELINDVVASGASEVLVGLGGSSTVDGGWGMAVAGGWSFRGAEDRLLVPGEDRMADIVSVGAGPEWPGVPVTALCDVDVPFSGDAGAILFAGQKGVPDRALAGLQEDIRRFLTLPGFPQQIGAAAGAGAAGGLGFGLAVFAGARIVSGAEWVLDRLDFESLMEGIDLILVVEGRFDATSLMGKLTGKVIARARSAGIAVVVLAPGWDGTLDGVDGVTVVTGGGEWSARDLEVRARAAVTDIFT